MDIRNDSEMTSSKPYFFRAMLEWIEDNGLTPHVLIDATVGAVDVPLEYVKDDEIVLNISSSSIKVFANDNDGISFETRFNGKLTALYLPIASIKAVFSKENQQGIFFNHAPDDASNSAEEFSSTSSFPNPSLEADSQSIINVESSGNSNRKKVDSKKKDSSHLKIIK